MSQTSTTAIVQVTVEIYMSTYGPEWTLGDMMKQVKDEAPNKVRNILGNNGRMIGEPIVKSVVTLEK